MCPVFLLLQNCLVGIHCLQDAPVKQRGKNVLVVLLNDSHSWASVVYADHSRLNIGWQRCTTHSRNVSQALLANTPCTTSGLCTLWTVTHFVIYCCLQRHKHVETHGKRWWHFARRMRYRSRRRHGLWIHATFSVSYSSLQIALF